MSLTINTAKMEGDVVHVIKAWATAYPAELVIFDAQMRQLREAQVNKSGMVPGGSMRHFGEIPTTLYGLMSKQFGKTWTYDVKLRNFFWQNFIVGKINRTSTLSTKPGEITA